MPIGVLLVGDCLDVLGHFGGRCKRFSDGVVFEDGQAEEGLGLVEAHQLHEGAQTIMVIAFEALDHLPPLVRTSGHSKKRLADVVLLEVAFD